MLFRTTNRSFSIHLRHRIFYLTFQSFLKLEALVDDISVDAIDIASVDFAR